MITYVQKGALQAGTHTVSYQAIAATRGIFTLPPAYALVEDQPEVMANFTGGTFMCDIPS